MENWFYDPSITFYMWSISHLVFIFLTLFTLFAFYFLRNQLIPYRDNIRILVGWALILSRLSLDIWYLITNTWNLNHSLPLELCSIATICCGIMLLTNNKFLLEVFYFIAIGGAIQAILTPDLQFGFPQFRFLQFFIDHTLLILAPLLLIWLYQYSITWRSLWKSFLTLNLIALFVFIINMLIDANYMFLREKPQAGSLLDFLGPYPYYILSLEIVCLIIFSILYIPFYIVKRKNKYKKAAASND